MRFEPQGWEPISDHMAKRNPDQPSWPRCTVCGKSIAHHVTRWERFMLWLVGR